MQNEFEQFYQNHLSNHGNSAQGVGWKNTEAQHIRFEQLIKVININDKFSVNDLGCGVGDFVPFLDLARKKYAYAGYDVLNDMIQRAKARFSAREDVKFAVIENAMQMQPADFTVASGIFNIRFTENDDSWLKYILDTIRAMNEKSTGGFAFNLLTKYSDREFMKPELYYADPGYLFDYCKRNFSRNVAVLHDYNQYDFTVIVRKNL
jgi:SAM-dependent methyltransferase